jgi:hypothetical protein
MRMAMRSCRGWSAARPASRPFQIRTAGREWPRAVSINDGGDVGIRCAVVRTHPSIPACATRQASAHAPARATVRNRSLRIYSRFMAIAASYKEAIAEGRFDDLARSTPSQVGNVRQRQEHEADVERRNSRTRFPRSL